MPSSGWNTATTSKTRADPPAWFKKKLDSALKLLFGDPLYFARMPHFSGCRIFMYKLEELDKEISEQGDVQKAESRPGGRYDSPAISHKFVSTGVRSLRPGLWHLAQYWHGKIFNKCLLKEGVQREKRLLDLLQFAQELAGQD